MEVDRYERAWIYISAGVLVALLVAIFYSAYGLDIQAAGNAGRVDPAAAATTPPFDRPGVRRTGPDRYEVVMVARAWLFNPAEVRVPAGSTVTFTLTSADVIHGFRIPRTAVNVMVVPGQVARVTHQFRQPGIYPLFCHEYCGIGHHAMSGRIIVEPRG